jgi:hypothetical protein
VQLAERDPARMITKNIGGYLSENMTVLRSFAQYLTMGEVAAIERLKPGEGGLFRSGLKKIAVCRDEQGHLHAMGYAIPIRTDYTAGEVRRFRNDYFPDRSRAGQSRTASTNLDTVIYFPLLSEFT